MPSEFRGKIIALLGAMALVVAGCRSPAENPDAPATASTDEFSKNIEVSGPLMAENPLGGIAKFYNLVTLVDKRTAAYTHLISASVWYNADPINFEFAADDTAQTLRLVRVSHTRGYVCTRCSRGEDFNIIISDAALRAHAATGYRVKVSARAGESIILAISPAMIAKQFEGIATVIAPAMAAATSAATPAVPQPGATNAPTSAAPASAPAAANKPPLNRVGLMMIPQSTSEMTHGAIRGAAVMSVMPNSPADIAGVKGGDLIVRFDGHDVDSGKEVQDLIEKIKPTGAVKLDILRGPTHITANVKLP